MPLINPYFDEQPTDDASDYFSGKLDTKSHGPLHETVAKKQAAMVAVMDNSDIGTKYLQVQDELTKQGRSEEIERIRNLAFDDLNEDDQASADLILRDPALTVDQKVTALTEIQTQIDGRKKPSLEQSFIRSQMLNAYTNTNSEDAIQRGFFLNEEEIQKANSQIEDLKRKFSLSFDSSTGQAVADFASVGLLPGFGVKLKQIIDDVLPEEGSSYENLLPGEAVKRFKQTFVNAQPEDRVELAKYMLEAVDEWSGIIFNNDYERYSFMNTLLGDLNPSDAEIETDRWIDNVFGVLDWIPILSDVLFRSISKSKTTKGIPEEPTITQTPGETVSPTGQGLEESFRVVEGELLPRNPLLNSIKERLTYNPDNLIDVWEKPSKGSVIHHIETSAPNNSREWLVRALNDDKVAEASGVTREQIVADNVMPDPLGGELRATVDINEDIITKDYLGRDYNLHGVNYTPVEKRVALERTQDRIDRLAESEGVELLSSSRIHPFDGGYEVHFSIGHSSGYGFPTPQAALDSVGSFIEAEKGASLFVKDLKSNTWEEVTGVNLEAQGEFIAQIRVKHVYNPEDVLSSELNQAVVGVSGNAAKYLDKSSVFKGWIVNAGNVAADKGAAIRNRLEKTLRPLTTLSPKKQSSVFDVLDQGDRERKWFTQDELHAKFEGDTSLIKAYNAVRKHQDDIYELQNVRLRTELENGGFGRIRNEKSGFDNVGKPVPRQSVDLTEEFYDPLSQTLRGVSSEEVDMIYQRGGYIAQLKSHEYFSGPNNIYDRVIVDPSKGTLKIQLPEYVLNKLDGYITRVYDTTHIVKRVVKGVRKNGRPIKAKGETLNGRFLKEGELLSAVKMASNRAEAERIAARLSREAPSGHEYGVVEANELRDLEYVRNLDFDYYRDKGQLFFGKRGAEVESVTGQRSLSGIAESLEKARNAVSRHISMDDFLDSMTTRWESRYGKLFGDTKGKMPVIGIKIPRPADTSLHQDWKDAVALRDHISLVAGIDPTAYKKLWRNMVIGLADRVAGSGGPIRENIASWLLRRRDTGPIELLKQAAFLRFIALNPARQLLLQSQQVSLYLGLEHGFKYFAKGEGIRDFIGLTLGSALRDRPDLWRHFVGNIAKGMGMSVDEYRAFIDAFRTSGLKDAIDSHPFATAIALGRSASASDSRLFNSILQGKESVKSALRLFRKIGFDSGEYTNIATAWLATRNKWIKNNPDKDWLKSVDEISGEARAIGLNMNPAGALAYQRGSFGLLTQFMSHATKSLQLLVPERALGRTVGKLSNKAFSGKERFRIALSQLGIYGIGGFGLYQAYESIRDSLGLETPPEAEKIVREGIGGLTVNSIFHAADVEGENTDLAFSESFGPFSGTVTGTPLTKVFGAIADGIILTPDLQALSVIGAGMSLPKEMASLIQTSKYLIGDVEVPDIDNVDKALLVMRDAMRLLPGYNNYIKGKFALKSGEFATRSGNPTVQAASGEILAQMFFGMRSRKEIAVNEMLRDIYGETVVSELGLDKALRDTANTLYQNTLHVVRQAYEEEVSREHMLEVSKAEREALRFSLSDEEYHRVIAFFQERVFQDLNENKESKLTSTLASLYSKGTIPYESATSTRIRNMPDFKGKDALLKWIDTAMESPLVINKEK